VVSELMLLNALEESNVISVLIKHKDFETLNRLLNALFNQGLISRSDLQRLALKLLRITNAGEEEFEKLAEEFEKELIMAIRIRSSRKRDIDILREFNMKLEKLYKRGLISRSDLQRLALKLLRITNAGEEEFEKLAEEFEKELMVFEK